MWNFTRVPNSAELETFKRRALPSKSDDRAHVTYWLHDDSCLAPDRSGYVGVALLERLHQRFLEHKRSRRFPDDVKLTILQQGFAETCYLYEAVLRPHSMIGWNIAAGGARGNRSGIVKSAETKQKIGAANKGRRRPDLAEMNRRYNARKQHISCVGCRQLVTMTKLLRAHRKCGTM